MNRITLSLLTLGLSLGAILCWGAEPNADQAEAIAEIKKLNGMVMVDGTSPDKPVTTVFLNSFEVTDADVEHLKRLTKLQSLALSSPKVTDAALVHLKGLTDLRFLSLSFTHVTDAGLEHLKGLTSLQALILNNTRVTDAGLEHLKGLTNLRSLDLSFTRVTDAGVEHLKGLTNLQSLNLLGTKVTPAGLERIKVLTKLQSAFPGGAIIQKPPDEGPANELEAAAKQQDDPAHQAELATQAAAADRLVAARHAALAELSTAAIADYQAGKGSLALALDSIERLAAAELDAGTTPAERLAAREKLVRWLGKLEVRAKQLSDTGKAPSTDLASVKAARLDAEIALHREQFGQLGTPAEIKVLRELVDDRATTFRQIHALYMVNAKGGEADKASTAARDLCSARANLALAQADKPAAIRQLKLALKYAEEAVAAVTAAYQTGTATVSELNEAGEERSQIELKLLALSPDAVEAVRKPPAPRPGAAVPSSTPPPGAGN